MLPLPPLSPEEVLSKANKSQSTKHSFSSVFLQHLLGFSARGREGGPGALSRLPSRPTHTSPTLSQVLKNHKRWLTFFFFPAYKNWAGPILTSWEHPGKDEKDSEDLILTPAPGVDGCILLLVSVSVWFPKTVTPNLHFISRLFSLPTTP